MRGLNLRRRSNEPDTTDDPADEFGDEFAEDDWDDEDWGDGMPWDDPTGEPVPEPSKWAERFTAARSMIKGAAGAVPIEAVVILVVLIIGGVVFGPQTGGIIAAAISPADDLAEADTAAAAETDPEVTADDDEAVTEPPASDVPAGVADLPRPADAPALPGVTGLALLAEANVSDEPPFDGGYDRSLYPHWTDVDGNGCDARQDILIRDFVGATVDGCDVTPGTGTLTSIWDGEEITDPSDSDVDHVVALGWAHASGAGEWAADDPRRELFANDPANLVAVSAGSNRAKGALGPDRWAPENPAARCLYANRFTRIVVAYDLTLTSGEHEALRGVLARCE